MRFSTPTTLNLDDASLAASPGAAVDHAVMACAELRGLPIVRAAPGGRELESGPDLDGPAPLPLLIASDGARILADDPVTIAHTLAPELFENPAETNKEVGWIRSELIDAALALGRIDDQRVYQDRFDVFRERLLSVDRRLSNQRYLLGDRICWADHLLFAFLIRIDAVYFELYKANAFLLRDLESLHAYARDLYERPELYDTTDFDAIKAHHYLSQPELNARGIVPAGGVPELFAPHFRAPVEVRRGVEEDQTAKRKGGEFVRGTSAERGFISTDEGSAFPAEADRYYVYAPYNCPWSHRVLLARSILGLEAVVGASVLYFRRDPERGWQFNANIPGCTPDLVYGFKYLRALYDKSGSPDKSAPVLWDTKQACVVNNESAEILRMFSQAFRGMGTRPLDLYPAEHAPEIDRLNEAIYQRINNGAYKAGFAKTQGAYERAFARYFAALDWLDDFLGERPFLLPTDAPTEADLRLFPTIYRHDAIYFSRFKLNEKRITDLPRLRAWLNRMLAWPGIAEACNLDHARNGYFGRTGNEIVPAGPVPLTLSPADYPRSVWLNED